MYCEGASVSAQSLIVLVVNSFRKEQVVRVDLGLTTLEQFVPLVVLLILDLEAGFDGFGDHLASLSSNEAHVVEGRVGGAKRLFLKIFGLVVAHQ